LPGPAVLLAALTAGALLMVLDAGAAGGGRPPQPQAAAAARIAVGDQAPDFELRSLEGASYRLGDLRGEKTAIVIFFRGAW
jgi:cytochrome oxidase Cu insertion factor (SCO1/SenC/PrrC family)